MDSKTIRQKSAEYDVSWRWPWEAKVNWDRVNATTAPRAISKVRMALTSEYAEGSTAIFIEVLRRE